MPNIDKEKIINGYKVSFQTDYSDDNGEFIELSVQIANELKQVLKKNSISEVSQVKIGRNSYGEGFNTYDRYKIKTVINNALSSNTRDLIFLKELVDHGKMTFRFEDIDRVLNVIECIKTGIRQLIEFTVGVENLTQEVHYNIVE